MEFRPERRVPWKVIGVWLFLLIIGCGFSISYEISAAPVEHRFTATYVQSNLMQSDGFKIIIAAHPQCPCTRATMHELQRLLCKAHTPVAVEVLFYRPSGSSQSWSDTDLFTQASEIKNCRIIDDVDGLMASKCGAHTSGETLLFDRTGHLLFHGGITGLRGHEGDNRGEDAILSLLDGDLKRAAATPVFGCSLGNWSADRE